MSPVKAVGDDEFAPTDGTLRTLTRDEALGIQDRYYEELDDRNSGEVHTGGEKTDNWLLSAYEKKGTSGGSIDIVPEPEGMQNGTAPLQDSLSGNKDNESSGNSQANGNKNAMPMRGEGEKAEPDFMRAEPELSFRYIYDELGLSQEEAEEFIDVNKKAADDAYSKLENNRPKMTVHINEWKEKKAAWEAKKEEAKKAVEYWEQVSRLKDNAVAEREAMEQRKIWSTPEGREASLSAAKTIDERRRLAEDGSTTPDFTENDLRKTLETGEVTVYSSKPIEQGIFVTPSKMEAESYAGNGKVYSKRVRLDDVAWIDSLQGQYAKVEETEDAMGVSTSLNKAETTLRDAVAKVLNKMGIKTHLDAKAQRILDTDNERRARLMGSRTNKKMSEISQAMEGRELTELQKKVVDVFGGKADNTPILIIRPDGNVRVIMRQGNDTKAGTKYSLFGHYGTTRGIFTADDVLIIPEVLTKGERTDKKRGNTPLSEYKYTSEDGTTYTVLTEKKHGREEFADFYTNRKGSSDARKTHSKEARDSSDEPIHGTKLQKVPEYDKEENEKIFGAAKERFGTTQDMREAGYILPDGTMLDFTGRHQVDKGHDTSFLNGRRSVDHRDIKQLNYEADGNTESGLNVSMEDFVGRGAVRIDANAGVINLSARPTKEQRDMISRLIRKNGGDVSLEIGMAVDIMTMNLHK